MVVDYVLSLQGDAAEARRYSSEALRLFQRGNDLWHLAFATGNRGLIAAREGEAGWAEAEHYLQLAESYIQEVGDPWLLTGIQQLGELQRARQYYEESIPISRDIGELYDLATAHYHLGQVCQAEGSLQQVQHQFQTSLALRREIKDRPGIAACFDALAEVAAALGQADAAEQYRVEAQQAPAAPRVEETGS